MPVAAGKKIYLTTAGQTAGQDSGQGGGGHGQVDEAANGGLADARQHGDAEQLGPLLPLL